MRAVVLAACAGLLVGAALLQPGHAPPSPYVDWEWQNLAGYGPVPECWHVPNGTPCWHVAWENIPPVPAGCYRLPGGLYCETSRNDTDNPGRSPDKGEA